MSEHDQPRVEIRFTASRSLRRVPLDWEHPKDDRGNYIPLFDRSTYPRYTEEEVQEMLDEGDISSPEDLKDSYAPDFSNVPPEKMGICAYEDTSEGTPISPVFPDTPEGMYELVRYCAENRHVFAHIKSDVEGWAAIFWGNALVDPYRGVVEAYIPPPSNGV